MPASPSSTPTGEKTALPALRPAVQESPDYPFTHHDAPVKLDQNEAPDDFPAELKEEVFDLLRAEPWHRYPDMHAERLRAEIARLEGWAELGVVVTPGSNVLIHALADAAGIGGAVVTVSPAFSLYGLAGKLLAEDLRQVPLGPDFALPVAGLIEALSVGSGVLYLAEPHAPTGALHANADLRAVIDAAGDRWVVVLDEAYAQFSGADLSEFYSRPNVARLKTFSKAWALGGARLGYLLAAPELASAVRKLVLPFNVSSFALAAGQVAVKHAGLMTERVQNVVSERERVHSRLVDLPAWHAYPSFANFHLIRTPDAAQAWRLLLDRGVLVRRQDSLPGLAGCIRVSVGNREDNDRFLQAAAEVSAIQAG
ncbi:MAG TPA: histidinol-phosphate transaminase [Deinococcales bacterium]|nr:histidinol-phosphate transaminase [Deinococcales bacterium]